MLVLTVSPAVGAEGSAMLSETAAVARPVTIRTQIPTPVTLTAMSVPTEMPVGDATVKPVVVGDGLAETVVDAEPVVLAPIPCVKMTSAPPSGAVPIAPLGHINAFL